MNASDTAALVISLWNTPNPSRGIVWPEESLTVDVNVSLDTINTVVMLIQSVGGSGQ